MDYICGNFWAMSHQKTTKTTTDIGYKDTIILQDIEKYSIFEEKILSIFCNNILYVFIINKNGKTVEDATTLITKIQVNSGFEYAKIRVDDYIYIIDFSCNVSCQGRF